MPSQALLDFGKRLSEVRQLIDAHGGKLELMSEPGEGTSAIVTLP